MKSVAETSFDEAKNILSGLLISLNLFPNLLWVFHEDVAFHPKGIFIKAPLPAANERLVKECYELGQKRGFGVGLQAFCLLASRPCCYIVIPKDEIDAQYMLLSSTGVRYSVRNEMPEAQKVESDLKWWLQRWQSKRARLTTFDAHLTSRESLLPDYRAGEG